MKMRNLLLSLALLIPGAVRPESNSQTETYKQEFAQIKEDPNFKNLFDEDLNGISHNFERKIQIYKAVPSKWQRFTCSTFLAHDVIAITPEMMPKLYAFIENLAIESGMPTPTIFISLNGHVFNAFAAKLLNGKGGILIEQKLLNELTDVQLEAVVAHELGHIKHNHVNKMVGLSLGTTLAAGFGFYKLISYLNGGKTDSNDFKLCVAGSQIITMLAQALIIGKRYEKQADQFACEAGHAPGIIELMNVFEDKVNKVDAELIATNDKLLAEKANLTPADFAELQQDLSWANKIYRFARWVHEKTPFESHPSNKDRMAAAQAYLDAQAQVPAIEKA